MAYKNHDAGELVFLPPITRAEQQAVCSAVRGSIDLYDRYFKLQPEDTVMKRKQGKKAKALVSLKSALQKLKGIQ